MNMAQLHDINHLVERLDEARRNLYVLRRGPIASVQGNGDGAISFQKDEWTSMMVDSDTSKERAPAREQVTIAMVRIWARVEREVARELAEMGVDVKSEDESPVPDSPAVKDNVEQPKRALEV